MGIVAGLVEYVAKPIAKTMRMGFKADLYVTSKLTSRATDITRKVTNKAGYKTKETAIMTAQGVVSDIERVVIPETKRGFKALYQDIKETCSNARDKTAFIAYRSPLPFYALLSPSKADLERSEGPDSIVLNNWYTRIYGFHKEVITNTTHQALANTERHYVKTMNELNKNFNDISKKGKKLVTSFGKVLEDVPRKIPGRIHYDIPDLLERQIRNNNVTIGRFCDYVEREKGRIKRSTGEAKPKGELLAMQRVLNSVGKPYHVEVIKKQLESDLYKQDGLITTGLELVEETAKKDVLRDTANYLENRTKTEILPSVDKVRRALVKYRNTSRDLATKLIDTHSLDVQIGRKQKVKFQSESENVIEGEFVEVKSETAE